MTQMRMFILGTPQAIITKMEKEMFFWVPMQEKMKPDRISFTLTTLALATRLFMAILPLTKFISTVL